MSNKYTKEFILGGLAIILGFIFGYAMSPTEIVVEQVTETVVDQVSYDKLSELQTELELAHLKVIEYDRQLQGYREICNIDVVIPPIDIKP